MRNHRETSVVARERKSKACLNASTHPCASASPRHRLVELLWSFGPAFQRWSDSLMTEKKLSSQRLRILGSLHERGSRIMSDLKEELGVTATNITALVDSLEKDGLVVRRSHPTDRRATMVELSAKAKGEVALGCSAYKDRVAELFSDLNDSECREFTRTLEKLWSRLQG
jgi:DNA-binding MarR family transcriptional regulator